MQSSTTINNNSILLRQLKEKEKQKFTIIIRLRPQLKQDFKTYKSSQMSQSLIASSSSSITISRKNNQQKIFKFNSVFNPGTQPQIYTESQHLIDSLFDGYNSTFLAYGQTGTGKTHTVFGSEGVLNQTGFFYMSVKDIFKKIKQRMHSKQFAVRVSFVEFYLDNVYDLIANDNKKLQLKENSQNGLYVKDLVELPVKNQDELFGCVRQAIKLRKTEQTSINKRSSRSHAVIQITLLQRWNQNGQTQYLKGYLKIVDLAGSQRVSKTQSYGNRLEQAKRINKQITTLGKCINMLAIAQKQGKIVNPDITNKFNFNRSYIPYRDAKITRFLSDSLQGKAKIILCVCVSKYLIHIEESFSSLLFASQASTLKIDSKRNQIYTMTVSTDKGKYQTPIKSKGSLTPTKNINFPSQQSIQLPLTKILSSQPISNQLKQNLLQKFKNQVQQIEYFLKTKQIKKCQKHQKQTLQNNLSQLNSKVEMDFNEKIDKQNNCKFQYDLQKIKYYLLNLNGKKKSNKNNK